MTTYEMTKADIAPESGMEQGRMSAGDSDHIDGSATTRSATNGHPLLSPIERTVLEGEIIEAMRTIYDPEIPVNIYDLGLIYEIDIHADASVDVRMTLTSPGCPVAGTLPPEVEEKVASVPGVADAHVEVVWDPPYTMDMMSDEAKLDLGLF